MEILDVVSPDGLPTGRTCTRGEAHALGLWHRTAHVWIASRKGDGFLLLLQKRSMRKESWPGLWDISAAGHVPAGEEPLSGALREAEEELGISAKASDLDFLGIVRTVRDPHPRGRLFRDREAAFVYLLRVTGPLAPLRLQAEEVEEVSWFPLEECLRAAREKDPAFCITEEETALVARALTGRSGE